MNRTQIAAAALATGFVLTSLPATAAYASTADCQGTVTVSGGGAVSGTVQCDGENIPDPKLFVFFKGLDDEDVNGILGAEVRTENASCSTTTPSTVTCTDPTTIDGQPVGDVTWTSVTLR